jgi:uncharacterized protein YdgA (DUF945 family)
MKKLLVAITIICVIVALSPKFIGVKVADERDKIIAQLNAANGISVKSTRYVANWFGAESISEVTFDLAEQGLGDITVVVDEQLSFGPFIVTKHDWFLALSYSEIKLHSSSELIDDEIMTFINEKVQLSTLFTFTNDLVTEIKTDEITFEDGNTAFKAYPALAKFSVKNYTDFQGELNWAGLVLTSNEGQLTIGKVNADTQQSVVSGNYLEGTAILTGDARFLVENIEFTDVTENDTFTSQNILITSSVSAEDELLKLELAYNADKIIALGQTFKQPNLDIILADVDINALQELNDLLVNIPMEATSQPISTEVTQQISVLADKFMAKDPSFNISDLSVVTESGKIESQLMVTLDKQLFDTQNLMSAATALNADAKGNAPAEFFTQFGVTPMINNLVEQGYLVKTDKILSFVAKYSQAKLSLNGKTIQY